VDTDIVIRELTGSADNEAYSPAWWRNRTSEELRDIINRGFAGGDLFAGAAAESARRSNEARRLAEQEAAELSQARRRRVFTRRILLFLVGLSLVATLFTVIVAVTHLKFSG
jgi:hypothetical protein